MGDAAARWAGELARWAIPPHILANAPEDPWRMPPELFAVDAQAMVSPSHRRALAVLPEGGSVIDVGVGGGAMSRPLRERAGRVTAVDASEAMLEQCDHADVRVAGQWPDVAAAAGRADVVVCGHVVYNVADIEPFVAALAAAARRRVVIELTARHPLHNPVEAELWRSVWDVERPNGPRAEDFMAVLTGMGIAVEEERWDQERQDTPARFEARVTLLRRHLCLPADRDPEIRAALERAPMSARRLVTASWDV